MNDAAQRTTPCTRALAALKSARMALLGSLAADGMVRVASIENAAGRLAELERALRDLAQQVVDERRANHDRTALLVRSLYESAVCLENATADLKGRWRVEAESVASRSLSIVEALGGVE